MTLVEHSVDRFILGAGLGQPPSEFNRFGEEDNKVILAEKLDESLEIITGLLSGRYYSFTGKHNKIGRITRNFVGN